MSRVYYGITFGSVCSSNLYVKTFVRVRFRKSLQFAYPPVGMKFLRQGVYLGDMLEMYYTISKVSLEKGRAIRFFFFVL